MPFNTSNFQNFKDIEIRELEPGDCQAWDQYVLNHPQAMPFHLSAWKSAIESAYGFTCHYLIAQRNGGRGSIAGVFPLVSHHMPLMKKSLVSLPYCDAGGPLADSDSINQRLINEAFDLAKKRGMKKIAIRAASSLPGFTPQDTMNPDKVRMVLTLGRDADTLLNGFKAKLRSQIKKPMRDGLSARMGGAELIKRFYPLFAENMRDLGSPVHSRKWIESVLYAFKNRAHLVLVTMPDGTVAAGGILLVCGRQVSVPWASSLRKYNRWNPNMLLYWTFLKYAADMGYAFFDFGRSTINEGTFRFKKQWGAKPVPLHWAEFDVWGRQHKFQATGVSQKRELAAQVIMKAPVPVATALGTALRRYISL